MAERAEKKGGRILPRLAALVCLAVFLVSGGLLLRYRAQRDATQREVTQLRELVEEPAGQAVPDSGKPLTQAERFAALTARNGDFAGWITIPGTAVDYPVMRAGEGKDGEYYLRRNFDGEYDINGLPFLDQRCGTDPASDLLIIYGHNMKSGIMFHDLTGYEKRSFWEEHRYLRLETLTGTGTYEVFCAMLYDASSDETAFKPHKQVEFAGEAQFDAYLAGLKAAALYDTGITPAYGEKLLMLATCERSSIQNGRIVVVARQVEK